MTFLQTTNQWQAGIAQIYVHLTNYTMYQMITDLDLSDVQSDGESDFCSFTVFSRQKQPCASDSSSIYNRTEK